jgi:alkylation response protein AidB-like acyl-CoA dehydrogenase
VVLHGAQAGVLLVSARTRGGQRARTASLFAVPAGRPGVRVTEYRMLDGQRAADVRFANVRVGAMQPVGRAPAGDILDAALDYGAGLLCAEALGAMEALFAATLDYLKTRQQFGAPIGKFQALQHRMADMYIHLEQARSMALLAAVRLVRRCAAAPQRCRRPSTGRPGRALRRPAGGAAAWRHGRHRRTAGGALLQAPVDDRADAGRRDHHLARFIAQPGFHRRAEAA